MAMSATVNTKYENKVCACAHEHARGSEACFEINF